MIAQDGHIRLIDFGLSKVLKPSERAMTVLGSPEYIAPEILAKTGYGFAADYWSLGVVVYELVHGRTPFTAESAHETY
jgi:serine/threonine protein kinase